MIEIIPNWHPIFVHFTVGLLLTSVVIHAAAKVSVNESLKQTLTQVANWNLWIGTGMTIATVAAGIYAFNTVTHDTPSHEIMVEHRNLALGSFVTFMAIAIWSYLRARKRSPLHWPLVIAVAAAGLLLISTAWHGGELVYRHGLGVMALPNKANHVHAGEAHDGHVHEDTVADEHGDNHEHSHAADAPTELNQGETPPTHDAQHEHTPGTEHDSTGHEH
jgi:uncharacterized membrane protein